MKYIVFFAILTFLVGCQKEPKQPPNIILIVVDDLGAHDVGYMGSTYYETPGVDRLASGGMVFTRAYAAAAVCSPTRAAIMTGKYPARLGITDWIRPAIWRTENDSAKKYEAIPGRNLLCPVNENQLDTSEVTIAELLKSAGYTTKHIGKWHLGGKGYLPSNQGFDKNFGGCDFGQPPAYFAPYQSNWAPEGIPGVIPNGPNEYLTDREVEEAVRFINSTNQPFFLNLDHYAVHTPIQPKPDLKSHFESKISDGKQNNAAYAAMIKSVDDGLGQILNTLLDKEILENTMIVFYSDNGGHNAYTSNAPLRSGKGNPWEGGIRVPLAVYWEGMIENSQCDIPVSSIDLLPTLAGIAGVMIPDSITIDGIDLSSCLLKNELPIPRELFWHFPHYRSYEDVRPYSIVRSGPWKLIRFWEGEVELYQLEKDPSEEQNLADENPEIVVRLNNKIDQWLQKTGARLPLKNPEFIEDMGN
ncbi:MAG: sulfatase [Bacteroidetes bacterium]|nr:sulfatase [Bacteroidota bacterium]